MTKGWPEMGTGFKINQAQRDGRKLSRRRLVQIAAAGTSLLAVMALASMNQLYLIFPGFWIVLILAVFLQPYVDSKKLFHGSMYLLVAATFLNQSVISINLGVFSLFMYRLVLIAASVLFIIHITKERNLFRYWDQVHVKGSLLFLLFWLGYGTISLIWAKSIIEGLKYLFLLGTGILFIFLAVFTFTKISRLYLFYGIWMIMTIGLLILGLVNHFWQVQLPSSTLYGASEYKLGYPTAVFYNQNDFAAFLTISFCFYLAAAKNSKGVWSKTSAILLAVLSVYIVCLTESRASLLAMMAALALYLFILLPAVLKKAAILAGSAITIAGTVAFAGKLMMAPMEDSTSSNAVRVNLLKNTLHYVLDTFGFGVGAGNLPFYLEHEPVYETDSVIEVHNWLAELLGNFGLFIFLGYIAMFAFLFFSLYTLHKQEKRHKVLLEASMVAMAAFLVASISPSSVSNLFFHWVFLGFVMAVVSVFKSKQQERENFY
jgi:teichuronic acid biosynthesis protein TuaE